MFSRLVQSIRRRSGEFLSLLYPPECALCGSLQPDVVCPDCRSLLPTLSGPRCAQCSDALRDASVDLCLYCGTHQRWFDHLEVMAPYEHGWRNLLHRFKFEREQAIGRYLGGELASWAAARGIAGAVDVVTYVPMTRRERRLRGFNQARRLAEEIGRELGLPVRRVLAKRRHTVAQSRLSAGARRSNLRDAFRVVRWETRRVLLVDDVCTTGSTVDECARMLRLGGCASVVVLAVARA